MSTIRRRSRLAAVVAGLTAAALAAQVQAMTQNHFNLPAQPLADALRAVSSQTDTQILFDASLVAGRKAPAVSADLTTEQALAQLLSGTGIRYEVLNERTVVLNTQSDSDSPVASTPSGTVRLAQAAATEPAPAEKPAASEEPAEVVITGSRLNIHPGMTSPTPVTQVTAAELATASPQSIAEGLAQLPALSTSTVPSSIGGRTTAGPGTFLSLRGLGSTRNLILFDGMRIAPSNVYGNVDVNLLPQSLIQDVQIVTGGASAAYGSDAVAGVTNFILNTKYKGFKADVSGGESAVEDGELFKLSVAWGTSFLDDRLHLETSFDWRDSKAAYANNRGWANNHCALVSIPGVTTANQSPTNPRQTIACNVSQGNSAYGGVITSGPWVTSTQSISFAPGGVPQPFVYGSLLSPVAAYNPATPTAIRLTSSQSTQIGGTGDPTNLVDYVNFYTPKDDKVLFGRLGYDVSDSVQVFAQITAGRTNSNYAQTPPYYNTSDPLTIYSGNPFIPSSIQDTMTAQNISQFSLGITPKSWGVIGAEASEESYDAILGASGKIGSSSWSWDAHAEHGRYQFREYYTNDISLARLYRALDVVTDPATGTPVCNIALTNPTPENLKCVPLNPFGVGSASPEALAYIHGTAEEWNVVTQTSAAADLKGDIFSTWAGPISLATGIEWRKVEGVQTSDETSHEPIDFTGVRGVYSGWLTQTGGWATTNVLPYSGSISVTEGYIEALVPLAKDLPFAKDLELNAAGRGTGYSQSGTVETWKGGVTWKPVNDLLLRFTRSRDIRAPNISDLYSPISLAPPVRGTDTVNGGTPFLVSYGSKGNPDLKPEVANTTTTGFTFQPSFLSGFALSADYYDIKISNVLATVSPQDTVDRCARGEQVFCNNIVRDDSGAIALILTPTQNLNQQRTRGVDFELDYRAAIGPGHLGLRFLGTRLFEQATTTVSSTGARYSDAAGSILSNAPHWIANGSVTWDQGPWTANLMARFVGSGIYNYLYTTSDISSDFYRVPSNLTFDLGVHYHFSDLPGSPEVYVQGQNIFNKAPPILPTNSLIGPETIASLYDTMGRFYSAGIRVAF